MIICVSVVVAVFTPHSTATDSTAALTPYAEFIAGCSLLRIAPIARHASRQAAAYRALGKITDLSAGEVCAFLESIRNDPKKGKELYDIMQQSFASPPDSTS
ncbi:MAG: hypothetical protein JXA18_11770 [Chitinispirillaceae bacterium]|nr:hypothetical protein [Chitinispirillaceae bacterium]